jgi:hypothetical protein
MQTEFMYRATVFLLISTSIVFAGCDPAMTIRQVNQGVQSNGERVSPQVALHISTQHPLIGEGWYSTNVQVTNAVGNPITVTGVELVTADAVYHSEPSKRVSYPLLVATGETVSLETYFPLRTAVYKTFEQRVQLRVHYRIAQEERTAVATLEAAPLNDD